jgi:DNA-binding MarR family transcriptional regulator
VRSIDARMLPLELTAMQWEPLFLLWLGRADTVAALARECHMDCGAMTRMLDRLELKELVRRQRSESDRRVVHLALTDKGIEAATAIPPVLREELARHLQDFSSQETDVLISMLQRMLDNGARA